MREWSDLKELKAQIQDKRIKNLEDYKDKILSSPLIEEWEERNNGSLSLNIRDFGIVDYFVKGNKVLIRKTNTWQPKGLNWLIKKLNIK